METWVGIIIAIISSTGGVTVTKLIDGWRDARRGRLDEAQRIAAERDKLRQERDQERRCKHEWQYAYHRARIAAAQHGVPADQIPDPPDGRIG